MRSEVWSIQKDLYSAWQGILASLRQMHPSTSVNPGNAVDVFKPDTGSSDPKFNIGPVMLNVPEKAQDSNSNLYIVVEGWLAFAPPMDKGMPRTTSNFGTKVGYFRKKDNVLTQVFGVHYDMDSTSPGHPVFHSQISTQADLALVVEELTKLKYDPEFDWSQGLLRNVRMPTAQMDAFSVFTQIGADHLVWKSSGREVLTAFKKLRNYCDFFLGAGSRFPHLQNFPAANCYRSTHWYVRNADNV